VEIISTSLIILSAVATSSAGGTAWNVGGAFANRFVGIQLSDGSTTATSVQNNTIANFVMVLDKWSNTHFRAYGAVFIFRLVMQIIGTVTGIQLVVESERDQCRRLH
jgi:hypothetical protein